MDTRQLESDARKKYLQGAGSDLQEVSIALEELVFKMAELPVVDNESLKGVDVALAMSLLDLCKLH